MGLGNAGETDTSQAADHLTRLHRIKYGPKTVAARAKAASHNKTSLHPSTKIKAT